MIGDERVASLFDAAKEGGAPTDADRARIRTEIAAKLAAVAVGGAAAKAIGAKAAGGTGFASKGWISGIAAKIATYGLGTKVVLATVGAGLAVAVVTTAVARDPSPEVPAESVMTGAQAAANALAATPQARVPTEPTKVPAFAPVFDPSDASTSSEARSVDRRDAHQSQAQTQAPEMRPSSTAAESRTATVVEPPSPLLEEEISVLRRAKASLEAGDDGAALDAIAEYQRRFPSGTLGEEARVVQVLALCGSGRGEDGRRLASSLRSSVAWDRIRTTCAIP